MNRMVRVALGVLAIAVAPSITSAQNGADRFQQALRKERIDGDLKGAIALYQEIIKGPPTDRLLNAKVLLQLGSAYEKQGSAEAKAVYQRILRDYADQIETATSARARLAVLSPPVSPEHATGTTVRQIWSGTGVDPEGAPTRDGRLLTFVDWQTGDLAVRDLATGRNRHVTNKGSFQSSSEYALQSVPSPDGRRIAYAWLNADGKAELRLIGIDGGAARVLFSNPEFSYELPTDWSPDGQFILTALTRNDHSTQIAMISTVDGSTRVLKTLDWRGPGKMTFSPDGKYIVYDTPPNDSTKNRDVYVLASDGSSESALVTHAADDQALGWSSDGKHILYATDRTGNKSLWLIPVAKGKPAGEPILVRRDAELSIGPMGITNEGAFMYGTDRSLPDIYVAAMDSATGKVEGQPTRLVEDFVGSNQAARWSPAGSEFVYRRQPSGRNNSRVLVVRSVATGAEHIVPAKLAKLSGVGMPLWSPDGQSIVVQGSDLKGRNGIFAVHRQTGDATMLVEGTGHQFIGWSSDGKSFVYRTQDIPNRTWALVKQNAITGQASDVFRITGDTAKRTGNTTGISLGQVSPRGEQVAFVVRTDTAASVLRVGATAGQSRELYRSPSGYQIQTLTWSADGQHIFFAEHEIRPAGPDTAKVPVMRIAITGGGAENTGLAMQGMNHLHASPDGKRISFNGGAAASAEVWVMENFLPKSKASAKPHSR